MIIPAGERWGGDPVRKLGDVVPRDERGRRRRKRVTAGDTAAVDETADEGENQAR